MNKEVNKEEVIKIEDLFLVIRKRWKIVVSVTAIIAIITIVFNLFIIKPEYQAEAKIFIGKQAVQEKQLTYNDGDVSMYQSLMKTYSQVIQTKDLLAKALKAVNQPCDPKSLKEASKSLSVTASADTQILDVEYTTSNKDVVASILSSILTQFELESKTLIPNVNIQVIEAPQVPLKPVSPNKTRNTIIGTLIGFVISIIIVFLLEHFDNTVKTTKDLEDLLEIPVIGSIPFDDKLEGEF